jgi:Leucine-rich repeat (LRR) protein
LNDNYIKGEELKKLSNYPNLSKIRPSNNPISIIDDIKILSKFENLEILELFECPITKIDNYRTEVYKILPNLIVLDMIDKDGELYESDCIFYFK